MRPLPVETRDAAPEPSAGMRKIWSQAKGGREDWKISSRPSGDQ